MSDTSAGGGLSWPRLAGALVILFAAFGCVSAPVHSVVSESRPAIEVSSDKSTVVFIRPGIVGPLKCVIVDPDQRYLGEFLPRTYTVRQMDPGNHVFYAWTNMFKKPKAPNMVVAEMAPGRVYYVFLRSWGSGGYSGVDIEVLSPRREEWVNLETWLARSSYVRVDSERGTSSLDPAASSDAIRRAKKAYEGYEPVKKRHHEIDADDGQPSAPAVSKGDI